jgi:hypothetical protein
MFPIVLLLSLLLNTSIFWYSFIALSLHIHANRELNVLTDNTAQCALKCIVYSGDQILVEWFPFINPLLLSGGRLFVKAI